jgi:hypothetical protein
MNWLWIVLDFIAGIVFSLVVEFGFLSYAWRHKERYIGKMIKQVTGAKR